MGGGECFSFCTQQWAGQRNSCASIILYCKDLYHTDLSPLMSPLYFSPAKNILLQYLTFMGPCIANIFQYISNKIQLYTLYLYLESALHVSGVTSTQHQERMQLYLQNLVLSHRYCYLPLSWKSWNWFECALGGVRHPQHLKM
jgi:hypothetical protein